jgi:hypothetical protein
MCDRIVGFCLRLLVLSVWLVGCAWTPAGAHTLDISRIMNAFVRIEPGQAHLVVRVSMELLRGLPFPVKGGVYDLAAADPVAEIGLLTLTDGFVLTENGKRLTVSDTKGRLSPNSDRSFEAYESAVAHIEQPVHLDERISPSDASFDIHFTYLISSPESDFKIEPQLAADLGVVPRLLLRYQSSHDDSVRAMIISGDSPAVTLDPSWYAAAGSFIWLGIVHILSGIDHLLFLFCLVIPFKRMGGLIGVITAFTLAHSVTLFASAFHLAPQGGWFPPFVETAIAASIVYMALENVVGPDLRRRWLITGLFGLVHGFGFADVLTEQLQFAGSYLLVSLFSFNIGIEIGQISVLVVMLPALVLCRRFVRDRAVVIFFSSIAALTAAWWMIERFDALRQQDWPPLIEVLSLLRWPALLLAVVAVGRFLIRLVPRRL